MSLDLTLDLFKHTQRKEVRSENLLKPIVKHFNRHKLLAGAYCMPCNIAFRHFPYTSFPP